MKASVVNQIEVQGKLMDVEYNGSYHELLIIRHGSGYMIFDNTISRSVELMNVSELTEEAILRVFKEKFWVGTDPKRQEAIATLLSKENI